MSEDEIRIQEWAKSLHDGGWRSSDHDQLLVVYVYDDDLVDRLCEKMEEMEMQDNA